MNNKRVSHHMVKRATRMIGNTLDLTNPSPAFKWRTCAESMFRGWERDNVDFQKMVSNEESLLGYCMFELVEFTNSIMENK
jgi:hypothetical protein